MHSFLPARHSGHSLTLMVNGQTDSQQHLRYMPLNQHTPYWFLACYAASLEMSALTSGGDQDPELQ